MPEKITKLMPSTKERPRPEGPADIVDIKQARTKRRLEKYADTSSALADALELIQGGHLSDTEIDDFHKLSRKAI